MVTCAPCNNGRSKMSSLNYRRDFGDRGIMRRSSARPDRESAKVAGRSAVDQWAAAPPVNRPRGQARRAAIRVNRTGGRLPSEPSEAVAQRLAIIRLEREEGAAGETRLPSSSRASSAIGEPLRLSIRCRSRRASSPPHISSCAMRRCGRCGSASRGAWRRCPRGRGARPKRKRRDPLPPTSSLNRSRALVDGGNSRARILRRPSSGAPRRSRPSRNIRSKP